MYLAFGLRIASPIHFLELPRVEGEVADVTIHFAPPPHEIVGLRYELEIKNLAKFFLVDGHSIFVQPDAGVLESELRLFLLGSCLGGILQQRGFVVLHGNSISENGDDCEIFVGDQGAGKSTIAAWQYLRGTKILADDICAIAFDAEGFPFVMPGYPQIKIWQNTASLLNIRTDSLRAIRPGVEKYALPLQHGFMERPLRLKKITELCANEYAESSLQGVAKFKMLVSHSYRYRFVTKMGIANDYHQKLARLAQQVNARRIPRPNFASQN